MSLIVVDASTTLAWCFMDEQSPAALDVLDRLNEGDQAAVPFFWSLEILNALLVGERRGRISGAQTVAFLAMRKKCPLATRDEAQKKAALALAIECI